MRDSELTKKKILIAAEEIFAQKGYWGARVDEIAKESHVNKRMIYVYFESKETLYSIILKMAYGRLAEVEKGIELGSDPEKAIGSFIGAYFDFLNENENFVKLIMWENLNEAKFIEQSGAGTTKIYSLKEFKGILKKGQDLGVFKKNIDENEIFFMMNMFTFSYFSNMYTMPKIINIDLRDRNLIPKRAEMITDMILSQIKVQK